MEDRVGLGIAMVSRQSARDCCMTKITASSAQTVKHHRATGNAAGCGTQVEHTGPISPFLSEWAKCQPGNPQNGETVLLIANLIADSESGSPVSY